MKSKRPKVMRVPRDFEDAIVDFQRKIYVNHGIKVPKTQILNGLAPKVGDLMTSKPKKKKKDWRFEFL